MRRLLWIAAALMVVYCGYWIVASRLALQGVRTAVAQMQAVGTGSVAGVTLAGFPSRFDVTFDRPALVLGRGRAEWSTAFLQVFALSWRPNRIIAVWPPEQTLRLPFQTLTAATTDMRASAAFGASRALPLDHSTLVATGATIASDLGWTATFDELRLATALAEGPNAHRLGLSLTGLEARGARFSVQGDAVARLTAPLDRAALAQPPRLAGLDLTGLQVTAGPATLRATGGFTVSADGTPEGRIDLQVTNWRDLLAALVTAGTIRPELAPTWEGVFARLSALSGDPANLDLPLILKGGLVSLGPLPLGPAPVF
jgi:hypothetical protein